MCESFYRPYSEIQFGYSNWKVIFVVYTIYKKVEGFSNISCNPLLAHKGNRFRGEHMLTASISLDNRDTRIGWSTPLCEELGFGRGVEG